MYPRLLDGAQLRARVNMTHHDDEFVAITSFGEKYFLEEWVYHALSQCNGVNQDSVIPNFHRLREQFGKELLEVVSIEERPRKILSNNQVREVEGLIIPCEMAVWHTTNRCNMKCGHCYYLYDALEQEKHNFSTIEVLTIAKNLSELGVEMVRLSGGEATISQQYLEFVITVLTEMYSIHVILNTNGWKNQDGIIKICANNPFVRAVQISVDGTKSSHDQLRGVESYSEVLANIKKYTDAGVYVRVVSMLTQDWLGAEDIRESFNAIRESGAHEWLIEVPSVTGRWGAENTLTPEQVTNAAHAFHDLLTTEEHRLRLFSLNQVFDYPEEAFIAKELTDPMCSHDIGMLSFGPEGVSFCTLFRDQFGERMSSLGSMAASNAKKIWHDVAIERLKQTIADNPSCRGCELFAICQGGCPGQYAEPANFSGCDQHSRTLALARRQFCSELGIKP